MKSAITPALFALLTRVGGFGCAQSDNVIGVQPARSGDSGGFSAGIAGNTAQTTAGGAAAEITNVDGAGGSAMGTASGGSGANVADGGTSALVDIRLGNSGGTSGVATGGTAGSSGNGNAASGAGLLLAPTNGWVDRTSNALGIQGAFFAEADSTSINNLVFDFTGARACIKGTAAKVDMTSPPCASGMFTPPATDCYEQFWGAEVGLNLNQPVVGGARMPFDASALQGFSFDISGNTVPGPSGFRFQVQGPAGKFCNPSPIKIKAGSNAVLFSDLAVNCWNPDQTPTADTAKSALVSVEWWVVTNASSSVPYDFCVSNLRALRQ